MGQLTICRAHHTFVLYTRRESCKKMTSSDAKNGRKNGLPLYVIDRLSRRPTAPTRRDYWKRQRFGAGSPQVTSPLADVVVAPVRHPPGTPPQRLGDGLVYPLAVLPGHLRRKKINAGTRHAVQQLTFGRHLVATFLGVSSH